MIADTIEVNGEPIAKSEAMMLIRMICNDAKEIAGVFHGMNRSEKFRANWPSEYVFADANWRNFMEAARAMYAERLGNPKTPPNEARMMHLSIVLWDMVAKAAPEAYPGIQLAPNTQQFEGDKIENRKIVETWGKRSNTFKELLMGSTRYH